MQESKMLCTIVWPLLRKIPVFLYQHKEGSLFVPCCRNLKNLQVNGRKPNYHLYVPICRSAQYNMNIYYYNFFKKLSQNKNLQPIRFNQSIICNEILILQIYQIPLEFGRWSLYVLPLYYHHACAFESSRQECPCSALPQQGQSS